MKFYLFLPVFKCLYKNKTSRQIVTIRLTRMIRSKEPTVVNWIVLQDENPGHEL